VHGRPGSKRELAFSSPQGGGSSAPSGSAIPAPRHTSSAMVRPHARTVKGTKKTHAKRVTFFLSLSHTNADEIPVYLMGKIDRTQHNRSLSLSSLRKSTPPEYSCFFKYFF
jgi:hypothetical protein